ncbi:MULTISPECIES: hypothetical protein [Rhizobium]|uniref:Uncharacterized protein n=1 Tax=Rhizobium esperanzae TaxID=1967781 RepID=A0A7W6UI28_9HYPH|nr:MULTISPECIES: hypothetical protein [Rhizobium]MBB4437417.1 hypothetical protein [Rhizobium esperanzae]MDH6199994.1 hypothetical protein [Rhizobium leguminosarum]
MPMIATRGGLNINSDHVVQYSKLRSGQIKVLLSTGGEHSVETYSDDLADLFIPVIPANPGFVAVFAERWEDGSFQYKLRSVVAWRRCPSGIYPLFQGYGNDDDYAVIMDPVGGTYDSDGNVYATLEDWQKEYEAEANELAATSHDGAVKAA